MIAGLRAVYATWPSRAAAVLLFAVVALFYAWAAQVLLLGHGGLSVLVEPDVIAAIGLISALLAVSLPVQLHAFRLAAAGIEQTGGTLLGALTGTASMSCCAPVLLPAVLSLLGFSGTSILSVNLTIHRYFVPLAALSAVLLGYSLISTLSSLSRACMLNQPFSDEALIPEHVEAEQGSL